MSFSTPETVFPKISPLMKALVFAGGLPFVFGALLSLADGSFLGIAANRFLLSYGAVIASFVSGLHWSREMFGKNSGYPLLIISNVTALAAWLALMTGGSTGLALLILVFAALLYIDHKLRVALSVTREFFKLRAAITALVISCLFTGLIAGL